MYNGNGRPLSKKKQVQLMICLTILAWATQTLRHQWGYGATVEWTTPDAPTVAGTNADSAVDPAIVPAVSPTTAPSEDADDAISGKEVFVPGSSRFVNGATLELRSEASIIGGDIQLKQICRWTDDDKPVFAPIADFVVDHIRQGTAFRSINVATLKSTLHDAGINMANINIVGSTTCAVTRCDAQTNQQDALNQWIDSRQGTPTPTAATSDAAAPATAQPPPPQNAPQSAWSDGSAQGVSVTTVSSQVSSPVSSPAPSGATAIPAAATEDKQYHSLRELLTRDLATRTSLSVDQLEMNFRAEDEKVLNLAEPQFKFHIDALRASDLGRETWNVTITAGGESHTVTIYAEGRAWQQQLVVARPVECRQVILPDDYISRRVLADSLPGDALLTPDQLANAQASQSLKPGTVLTARMIDTVPLVKAGQFVTVTIAQGGVSIKTVATAMESGSYGQTIRVRNETTREIFEVTMTGPQEATMASSPTPGEAGVAAAQ
jgi:flagella basal body P-ring formation protein FlgA